MLSQAIPTGSADGKEMPETCVKIMSQSKRRSMPHDRYLPPKPPHVCLFVCVMFCFFSCSLVLQIPLRQGSCSGVQGSEDAAENQRHPYLGKKSLQGSALDVLPHPFLSTQGAEGLSSFTRKSEFTCGLKVNWLGYVGQTNLHGRTGPYLNLRESIRLITQTNKKKCSRTAAGRLPGYINQSHCNIVLTI